MSTEFTLSISQLLDYFREKGDWRAASEDRILSAEGQRVHRRVQRGWPKTIKKEHALEGTLTFEQATLKVTGRADGFEPGDRLWRVHEIKTVRRAGQRLQGDRLQRAIDQLRAYSAFLLARPRTEGMPDRVEWVIWCASLGSHTPECLTGQWEQAELVAWHNALSDRLARHFDPLVAHRRTRNRALQELAFPLQQFRTGQREAAILVYRTLTDGLQALLEAPTGSGKSLATLFPALKALGQTDSVDAPGLILSLSARNDGQRSALDALRTLSSESRPLRVLQLQGRHKLCTDSTCTSAEGDLCPRRQGFYEKLPELLETLKEVPFLDTGTLKSIADRNGLCPSALQSWLSPWWDVLVGDYNYAFAPGVTLTAVLDINRPLLLVDEAHNLPGRARDMYSAELDPRLFAAWKKRLGAHQAALSKALGRLLRCLRNPPETDVETRRLADALAEVMGEALAELEPENTILPFMDTDDQTRQLRLSALDQAQQWLVIGQESGDEFRVDLGERGQLVRQCLSPARLLQYTLTRCEGCVFFSASLSPPDFYQEELGIPGNARKLRLPSPFPPQNACTVIYEGLSMRWPERDQVLPELCELIATCWQSRPGNYWVFSPSHTYQDQLARHFEETYPGIPCLRQPSGSSLAERDGFLSRFLSNPRAGIGFVVLGSLFNESVDLPGEALLGVLVLSTGRPPPDPWRDAIAQWYSSHGEDGDRLAYQLPGWQKVVQAAGRVIRQESDRGIVILVDARFTRPAWKPLFPPHWSVQQCRQPDQLRQLLSRFWEAPTSGCEQ